MRRTFVTALILASLCQPAWAYGRVVEVTLGRSEVVKAGDTITRVAISDPAVADVVVLPDREVIINGKAGGVTNLMVWTKTGRNDYQIRVGQDIEGLLPTLAKITGSNDLSVYNANGTVVLQGSVKSPKLKALAEKVAGTFAAKVISQLEVPPSEQIQVDIKVVEIAKTATKELGITWGTRTVTEVKNGVETYIFNPLQSLFKEGGPLSSLTGFNVGGLWRDPLTARLDLMVKDNKARILARPSLVANSGVTAKFLAGGEIPIPVQQALGMTTILWKEFGVRLEAEPTLLDDGRILMKLKPEVSSLDQTNGITLNGFHIPAIKTRKAETEVRLAPSESLILGGLLSKEDQHNITKLPLLGDIPILGELFKSHQFLNGETELMIIVTPRLVQASKGEPTSSNPYSDEFRQMMQESATKGTSAPTVPTPPGAVTPGAPSRAKDAVVIPPQVPVTGEAATVPQSPAPTAGEAVTAPVVPADGASAVSPTAPTPAHQ